MATGRPTIYSLELADKICEQIALGNSIRTVCAPAEMPAISSVYKWIRENESFSQQYARAKSDAADALTEEILDISDDGTNDWMEKHDKDGSCIGYQLNGEHVQRSKLRIDSRKWIAAKLKPKKYGDFQRNEVTGADGGPIQFQSMTDEELDKRLEQLIQQSAQETTSQK